MSTSTHSSLVPWSFTNEPDSSFDEEHKCVERADGSPRSPRVRACGSNGGSAMRRGAELPYHAILLLDILTLRNQQVARVRRWGGQLSSGRCPPSVKAKDNQKRDPGVKVVVKTRRHSLSGAFFCSVFVWRLLVCL